MLTVLSWIPHTKVCACCQCTVCEIALVTLYEMMTVVWLVNSLPVSVSFLRLQFLCLSGTWTTCPLCILPGVDGWLVCRYQRLLSPFQAVPCTQVNSIKSARLFAARRTCHFLSWLHTFCFFCSLSNGEGCLIQEKVISFNKLHAGDKNAWLTNST